MVATKKKPTRPRKPKRNIEKDLDEAYELLHSDPDEYIRRVAKGDPVVFASANLTNEKGDPLDFDNHSFQMQYLRDFSPELAVMKCSQVGWTTINVGKVLYLEHLTETSDWKRYFGKDTQGITIIYTFPTARDVEDFASTRFKAMVSGSEHIVKLMGGRRGVDAVNRKKIGNSFIYFRGSSKETQAISVPADIIINDEYDFSAPEIIETFTSRLKHSQFKWWWKFSTPTIPNYGIDQEYQNSNQFSWFIKCHHCGKKQQPRFPDNVKRKKVRGQRLTYWGCRKCNKELDRTVGWWVPRYENRDYHGYRVTPAMCNWIQPLDIVKEQKRYRSERKFRNYTLGEAWSNGIDLLTRELMLSRLEYGRPYNPVLDRQIFMGVDQGDVLHYEICRGNAGRREILKVGAVNSFHEIGVLMNSWNVSLAMMDALPNKKSAEQFAKDFRGRVQLAIYKEFDEEFDIKPSKMKNGVLLDRTNTLDAAAESWRKGESVIVLDQFRYSRIPEEWDNPSEKTSFIQQMGNMTRDEIENEKTGKSRAVWVKTGPDHYRHADNYAYMAWVQQGQNSGADLMVASNPVMTAEAGNYMEVGGIRSGFRTPF